MAVREAARGREAVGHEALELMQRLYPFCRSLTGDGVRATFRALEDLIPIKQTEIPSGTRVFDWIVPDEWNLRDAYIADAAGTRVVDFRDSTLHVVSYSEPVRTTLPLEALRERLHTLPDQPDLIPYRTSYYERTWGFCLSHRQLLDLQPGDYEVVIDSTLEPGHLSYAELTIEGEGDEEVLISTYVCHPSLANDNLSGIAVAAMLAKQLLERELTHTYRFLFAPGTIGPLAWLHQNRDDLDRIHHGLTFSCIGDRGDLTYKRSRRGTPRSTRRWRRCCATRAHPTGCSPGSRGAATSASSARRGSTCPSAALMRTPARRVRRLPHLRRRARADPPRVARGGGRRLPRARRGAREQPPLHEPEPVRRAAARAARALPLRRRRRRHAGRRARPAVGAQPERWQREPPRRGARLGPSLPGGAPRRGAPRGRPGCFSPSDRPGQERSRSEITCSSAGGQSMPKAGSSQRTPRAASGT